MDRTRRLAFVGWPMPGDRGEAWAADVLAFEDAGGGVLSDHGQGAEEIGAAAGGYAIERKKTNPPGKLGGDFDVDMLKIVQRVFSTIRLACRLLDLRGWGQP
jgi:hypothetical protein